MRSKNSRIRKNAISILERAYSTDNSYYLQNYERQMDYFMRGGQVDYRDREVVKGMRIAARIERAEKMLRDIGLEHYINECGTLKVSPIVRFM